MNILHSIGSLDQRSGGPLRVVLDMSALGMTLGMNSEVLGRGPIRIADIPIPSRLIHSLPLEGDTSHIYSPVVRHWCRENLRRFDGVILHGLWSATNWAISRECIAAEVPYILFPHGMLDIWSVRGQGWLKRTKKTLYWHWRERQLVSGSRAVFFTIEREFRNAQKTFRLPAIHPVIVTPFGFPPQADDSEAMPGIGVDQGSEGKIALFLGRVHPKKRPDILIESWAGAAVPRDWRLVIAGPGEPGYLATLADLARRHGIEDVVQFVGPVAGADKRYLFQSASWFLLPSEQENFGVAVLEAVSSGCALAISDQVYLADELPNGSEVLPVSLGAWTRFMRERMTNDTWRDETVKRVREHIGDKFSLERVGGQWVDQIEKVINRQLH
jgi:glycosyltransferase involved in cell wall biosynthesis